MSQNKETQNCKGIEDSNCRYILNNGTNLAHDDSPLNCKLQVLEGGSDDGNYPLHAVNLLFQEDVQRLQVTHLFQLCLDLLHKHSISMRSITVLFCLYTMLQMYALKWSLSFQSEYSIMCIGHCAMVCILGSHRS